MLMQDRMTRVAVLGIFLVLAFTALHMAQNVFAPFVTAVVFGIVLSPLANAARARGLQDVSAAVLVLLGGLGVIMLLAAVLWQPVVGLVEEAPVIWSRIQFAVDGLRESFSGLASLTDDLRELMTGEGAALVVTEDSTELETALVYAPLALSQIIIFVGALFFFILSRRQIYRALALMGDGHGARRSILEAIAATERNVSRYFTAITIINAALGLATYVVLLVVGMPSPALWAVLAVGLNFIPYLGPAIMTVLLCVGSVLTFSAAYLFLPPLSFVALNILEGQFITPSLLGRALTMNPLLVFMSLVFWIWLWGPIGGIIAIPLMLIATSFLTMREDTAAGQRNIWGRTMLASRKGRSRPSFSATRNS